MNGPLLRRTLAGLRLRIVLLSAATFAWGWFCVFLYTTFAPSIGPFQRAHPAFAQLMDMMPGNLFSVPGAVALAFAHPFLVAMLAIIAAGAAATAIAGPREAGTLELVLARPLARSTVLSTLLAAHLLAVAGLLLAGLAGVATGVTVLSLQEQLSLTRLPELFLVAVVTWGAFTAVALAASVHFDRRGPALGVSLTFLLANYVLEVVGGLWEQGRTLREWSLLHRLDVEGTLQTGLVAENLWPALAVLLLAVAFAYGRFARKDLPAPN